MSNKTVTYDILKNDGKLESVKGTKISPFIAARNIKGEWVVDHIPTGGKIFTCDSFLEAKIIGLAFFQACKKSLSKNKEEVMKNTNPLFKEFLYNKEYKKYVDFIGFINSKEKK